MAPGYSRMLPEARSPGRTSLAITMPTSLAFRAASTLCTCASPASESVPAMIRSHRRIAMVSSPLVPYRHCTCTQPRCADRRRERKKTRFANRWRRPKPRRCALSPRSRCDLYYQTCRGQNRRDGIRGCIPASLCTAKPGPAIGKAAALLNTRIGVIDWFHPCAWLARARTAPPPRTLPGPRGYDRSDSIFDWGDIMKRWTTGIELALPLLAAILIMLVVGVARADECPNKFDQPKDAVGVGDTKADAEKAYK